MISSVYFQILSLVYIFLLMIVYFSKKRINNVENRIYSVLIISNAIGLMLDIASVFTIISMDKFPIINMIVTKSYLIYLLTWISLLTIYIVAISINRNDDDNQSTEKKYKKYLYCFGVIYIISFLLIWILDLYYMHDGSKVYSYGPSSNLLYGISGIYMVVWLVLMVKNFKNIKSKKYLPMFVYMVIGLIVIVIQSSNPQLLLMTSMETFVTVVMYFTIENPDVRIIEQLEVAKDTADKANAAKTDFLSNMSHEIRTPLNAIVGFSDGIEHADSIEEAKENARDIISASNTLLEIVNSILDISKIEAGKLEIINSDYSAKELFSDLAKLVTPKMNEKALEFQVSIAEDLPKTLYGDKANIKKVITNLLSNAYKYTDRGFVKYTVNCVNQNDTCRLIVSVEDSGRGMKPESVNKLFTKFQRIDEDRNTTIEGTGLGLALTKQLVELMGGNIIVHTVFGEGSKFTVTLDQKIGNPDLKEEVAFADTIDLSDKKILVVDDNQLNLKVATKLLQRYNAKVYCSDNGYDCIEKINSGEKYDLILMDDMMPKMSGTETFKKLKEISNFNMPVIVLTANAITGMREKYIGEGFDDYLAKPIEKDAMIKSFNRIFKNYRKVEKNTNDESINNVPIVEDETNVVKEEVVVTPEVDDNSSKNADVHTKEYLESNNIDVNHGLELLGDMELYDDTMNDFVKEFDDRLPKLKSFYDELDMPNYAILVHAIKSDCKYLGIMELADLTYEHELKSKADDKEYVKANYDALIVMINHYLEICKKYIGKE